jgi:hypothetical protein
MSYLSVGDTGRRLSVDPRHITNAFYSRQLRDDLCPIVGGRRLIPENYVDEVARVLRRLGKLPQVPARALVASNGGAT